MSEEDAYLAGFFDGEGCIWLACAHNGPRKRGGGERLTYHLYLTASQTDAEPLVMLQERFGGRIVLRHENPRRKPIYVWRLNQQASVVAMLEALLPYLRVKRERALLGLRFRELYENTPRGTRRITDAEARERRALHDEMRRLNRRGAVL